MSVDSPVVNLKRRRAKKLGREITELFGLITAATYELLMKIAELDRDGLWEDQGLCSCAHWLNWQCGIGMNAAREKVRVARALESLPKVSAAFRRGEVSYSKVRAITSFGKAENEDYLLMIARHGTAHHVETLVRGYRRAKRLNDPEHARNQVESRAFEYHWDEDGSLVFNGRLPAEVGAMLLEALKMGMDRTYAEIDVTAETSRHCVVRSTEAISACRADALAGMAESYLATGSGESSSAERYQVMVHVTADPRAACGPTGVGAMRRRGSTAAIQTSGVSAGTIEDGPGVTAETSKRLCCDASISRLIEDEKGQPISIGRKSRVIPPPMRRALKARDKQCRFPGCTHRHFIDGHHVRHWSEGGETGLDNLVLLCRFHHHLVHEGGFGCEKDESGNVVFRDAEGNRIRESGRLPSRYRGNVIADLKARLEDRFIDSQTVVSMWTGEKMDRDLAVGLLCDLDHRPRENRTQL